MSSLAFSVFAFLSSASGEVPIDVGRFDPANFPDLITIERRMPRATMTTQVAKILGDRRCRIPGQNKRRFDITVPYAVLMDAEGDAMRVVVGEMDCAPLETLVGQIVVAQVERNDFEIEHDEGERWYVSDINFTVGGTHVAAAREDPDKVICKQGRPVLGTRLKYTRTCLTAAQWVVYEQDREQARRDMNNAGAIPPD